MGSYAHTIPDLEQKILEVVEENLLGDTPLGDRLRSHIADTLRKFGLIPADTAPAPVPVAPPVAPAPAPITQTASGLPTVIDTADNMPTAQAPVASAPATPIGDQLTAEHAAQLVANTGAESAGATQAPWKYDPITGKELYPSPDAGTAASVVPGA